MSLLEWLEENRSTLKDGIYKTDEFGHVFCSGMMVGGDVKPTFNKYGKVNKRIVKL